MSDRRRPASHRVVARAAAHVVACAAVFMLGCEHPPAPTDAPHDDDAIVGQVDDGRSPHASASSTADATASSDEGRLDPGEAAESRERPEGTIFRHELMRATHDGKPPYLLQQLGPEPYRPGGRFVGWRITQVWPGDPQLCAPGCDLKPGDVVVAINGKPIEYPEQLSDLMNELPTMSSLEVQMLRDQKLRKATYPIVD